MVLALLQQLRFRFENTVRRRPQPCRNPETYNLVAKTHNLIERLLFPLRFPLQVLFFLPSSSFFRSCSFGFLEEFDSESFN